MTVSDLSSNERGHLEGQIKELIEQRDVAKLLKYDIRLLERQIQDLEYSLEKCSEELITRAKAEAGLESWKTAALRDLADLRAETLSLCNINDEIRLQSDKVLAESRAENFSLANTNDELQLKLSLLSKRCKFLECCLKDYELCESSPLDYPPDETLVTASPRTNASDALKTPVKPQTLEEELTMLSMPDYCVFEGATIYGDNEVPDGFSDCAASRELYLQNDFQRKEGSYVDRASTSGCKLNENDATPFPEVGKLRGVNMAGIADAGSNLEDNLASENMVNSLVNSTAAQPGRKSSRIEVEDVSHNRLLFGRSELLVIWSSLGSRGDSIEPIRQSLVCNSKGCSSASQASKLARLIGLKCKVQSAFVLDSYRVALLRHYVTRRKLVVPRKNGRLDDLAGSMIEYVT